jgi:uncharacterized protein DUF4389
MAASASSSVYPELQVEHIQDPNRLWAIPLLGITAKAIILIPVGIWLMLLSIAFWVFTVINSLVVVFTGRYWDPAYELTLGVMRLYLKAVLYGPGLTDRYPGFGFDISDPLISLDVGKPENPSRLWAIPILSGVAKYVILIPYLIYVYVLQYAAWIGVVVSSFWVLFAGRYPESVYELTRDSTRVLLAYLAYFSGLSDRYPSFRISMNHAGVKVVLIVIACLLLFGNLAGGGADQRTSFR